MLIDRILKNTEAYKRDNKKSERKQKGQFFTSEKSAQYMARAAATIAYADSLHILDPGAGNGMLGASVLKYCIDQQLCRVIHITFVETDSTIIPLLSETARSMQAYASERGITCSCRIAQENFLTSYLPDEKYDIVICNPPYKKIRKDSPESKAMSDYVFGQPNLYSLFMVKGLNLLRDNGRFVYITPRSWTSGEYYKRSREYLLNNMNITSILLFRDRDNAYSSEEVLQETMITVAEKSGTQNENISLLQTVNDSFSDTTVLNIPARDIKDIGQDHYLLLPMNMDEVRVIQKMASIGDTFDSLGYEFKTGPVVEFRNKDALSLTREINTVPMYRSANISDKGLVFPADLSKPQYVSSGEKKLLIRNGNTIFLRRLAAKEETRRLQSCVYYKQGQDKYISVENHVNYLTRKDDKPLTKKEVEWINSVLMSEDYDIYYRVLNGSTQVNAGELNNLPLQRRA